MIQEKFRRALQQYPDRPFIVSASGQWSFAGFYKYVCQIANKLDQLEPGRLACHLPDSPLLIAVIFAAAIRGRSLVLFNHDYTAAQIEPLVKLTEAKILVSDSADLSLPGCRVLAPDIFAANELVDGGAGFEPAVDSEIVILTSGTTGQPKCALYFWNQLLAQIKVVNANSGERWLLAYRLNHFAGIQMLAHALCNGCTLVLAKSQQVSDAISALVEYQVTHISATPTFWRFAMHLLADQRAGLALQHITLGSEAASGDLLQRLHELFPAARIVHIYASTEAGSCVSVSDMKPGLPVAVLDRPENAEIRFRIIEGELQIKARHGMSGYIGSDESPDSGAAGDGWRASGDLVRIENDRIIFVGRKSETINVGGVKVHPLDVESRITPVPGVKLARVYGKTNPIAGSIVAVDVICQQGFDPADVEVGIREACKELVPAARPRSINFVDAMQTSNLKLSRK